MRKLDWLFLVLWVFASALYVYALAFAPHLRDVSLIPPLGVALAYCLAEMAREIRNSKEWK